MSVTSSTDPVQTVIDLLDNASASDWTGNTAPDRIERSEDSEPSEKLRNQRRTDVSLYCWSPVEGDLTKFDASGSRIDQTEVVQIDVYTRDASTTNNYASDVVSILAGYATDNADQTQWVDIWPESGIDSTAQNFYREGFAVISVQCRLRRNATA